jgi:hypothetical protein
MGLESFSDTKQKNRFFTCFHPNMVPSYQKIYMCNFFTFEIFTRVNFLGHICNA